MINSLLFIILNILIIGVFCNVENNIYLRLIKENDNLFKFYNPNIDHFQSIINNILINFNQSINSECENSLIQINRGINEREEWALKYFESNGKLRDGFISGYNLDLGNYDLCLSLNSRSFDSQYCLVSIQSSFFDAVKEENFYKSTMINVYPHTKQMIDFNYGSVIGVCIPLNCNLNDLIKSSSNILNKFNLTITTQNKCSTANSDYYSNYFNIKFLICLLLFLIPFCISIISLFINYEHKYLKPFSLEDNFNYIYTNHPINDDSFIHGLKFVYIIISVPYHLIGIFYSYGYASFLQASVKSSNFYLLRPVIERGLLGIDVMIALSGFRLYQKVYDSLKKKKSMSKILLQWPINYWPGYIAYICLLIILPSIYYGPYRDLYDHFLNNCKFNWYKLFTFTNNYDYLPEMCVIVSWFNSANFQLSLIHYILVFVFIRNYKLGLIFTLIQLGISIVIEYYRMITLNIPGYMTNISDEIVGFEILRKDYTSLFSHLAPFTIGFLTGYFYKHNKTSYLNNSIIYYGGWIFSVASLLFSLLFPELFENKFISKDNSILIKFYFCMKRIFFSIPFIFIFCSFKAGRAATFKRIASYKFYQPISKLAPTIITCQFLYFMYFLSTRKTSIRITIENLIRESILTLVFVFIISNLFYFFFDGPIVKLLRKLILEDEKKLVKENEKKSNSQDKKNE